MHNLRFEMAKKGKKVALDENLVDRISDLPINVITHILDFLHIKSAAKTSVLSRKWRYIWASHPNIKIRYGSLPVHKKKRESALNDMTNIINKILFQHIGPIQKFNLQIPQFDPTNDFYFSLVDQWLMYLSRNGIKELTLNCEAREKYILPSHIYFAPELVILGLRSCIVNSPNGNGAFRKLKTLNFNYINFQSGKITSAFDTPQLTNLTFEHCSKVCHFKICAPKLKTLILIDSEDVELIDFEMSEFSTIALTGGCTFKETDLAELFERWCGVSSLYVEVTCFKFLTADTRLEMLPTTTICLRHLVLREIDWTDLHQISCILYLLRSSTSLSRLEIEVDYSWGDPTNEAANHLDATHDMNWTIDCLETVVIKKLRGSEEEMRFIKFLLSCSPKLKKIFVEEMEDGDPCKNYNLLKELVRFPRASKEAEIILKENVEVADFPELNSLYGCFL